MAPPQQCPFHWNSLAAVFPIRRTTGFVVAYLL